MNIIINDIDDVNQLILERNLYLRSYVKTTQPKEMLEMINPTHMNMKAMNRMINEAKA